MADSSSNSTQELCTEKALRAIQNAHREHADMSFPESLLLGLMKDRSSIAGKHLRNPKVDERRLRQLIIDMYDARAPEDELKRILDAAYAETRALGDGYIGTEHLLLALLADNRLTELFSRLNIEPNDMKADLLRLLGCGSRNH